jgi:hypothetical protein
MRQRQAEKKNEIIISIIPSDISGSHGGGGSED